MFGVESTLVLNQFYTFLKMDRKCTQKPLLQQLYLDELMINILRIGFEV